jgi:hypothetical protein
VAVTVLDWPVAIKDGGLEVNVIFTGNSHERHPPPPSQINGCQPAAPPPDVRRPAQPAAKHTLEHESDTNNASKTLFVFPENIK